MATSVPAPMATPEISLGQRRGVATRRRPWRPCGPWACNSAILAAFVPGQHLGDDGVDAELVGDAWRWPGCHR